MKALLVLLLMSLFVSAQRGHVIGETVWDFLPGSQNRFQTEWNSTTKTLDYSNTAASDSLTSKDITFNPDHNGNVTLFTRVDNTTGTLQQVHKLKLYEPVTNSVKSINITWYDWIADTSIGDTITAAYDNIPLYYSTNNILSNWASAMYTKVRVTVHYLGSQAGTIRQGVYVR
jgi:hypothetical protein